MALRSAVEAVTHPAHADHKPRLARLWFDLLAQVCDMGIHNAIGDEGLVAPNSVLQPVSAQYLAEVHLHLAEGN
jgi:hypothetical protein